jgi:hypothetical protein
VKKLSIWKLLDDFRRRLAKAQVAAPKREKRPGGPERPFVEGDYFSLMLFGLFNPVLDSMHGLCAATYPLRCHFSLAQHEPQMDSDTRRWKKELILRSRIKKSLHLFLSSTHGT